MREVIRTFVRLVIVSCVALVVITAGAAYFAGVPYVLAAMAAAAVPAVMVAGAVETWVMVREAS